MTDTTVDGIEAMLSQAKRLGLLPTHRYGTVQAASGSNAAILMVILDGDEQPSRVFNTIGPVSAGARVFTVSVAPHGIYAIGSPDNASAAGGWLALGTADAPYGSGWANTGGSFRNGAYRLRQDGDVELAGLISQSGTVTAPNTMFTLPAGFRPSGDVQVSWTASNNPAATTAPTPRGVLITSAGLVRVTHFAGTINPGPISLDGLSFAVTTI